MPPVLKVYGLSSTRYTDLMLAYCSPSREWVPDGSIREIKAARKGAVYHASSQQALPYVRIISRHGKSRPEFFLTEGMKNFDFSISVWEMMPFQFIRDPLNSSLNVSFFDISG